MASMMLLLGMALLAQEQTAAPAGGAFEAGPFDDAGAAAEHSGGLIFDGPSDDSPLWSALAPARFTLKHELANQISEPYGVANNRTSFRVEYEKHFLEDFYLQFDSKITAFWGEDHRAQASADDVFFESSSRDAYLQFSKANTSVKLGRQILIWGESDAGAVTDVISPRNFSELFFISLEESRISQFMLNVDQFSSSGDWSVFYVPDAQFNEYPEPGTAYFIDPFAGVAEVRGRDEDLPEYGLRWKKTFGRSDLSLMAARLIDNDIALRQDGFTEDGRLLLRKVRQRFDMIGATLNYATGDFLYSVEIANKSPKAFNNAALEVVEKDVIDASVRVECSIGKGGGHSISLEAVNKHVRDWSESIERTPRNTNSLVLGWNNTFFNENLTVNLLSVYTEPYESLQHSLFLTYKWSDRISVNLDVFYATVDDRRSDLYPYRKQNNAVFKFLYQF